MLNDFQYLCSAQDQQQPTLCLRHNYRFLFQVQSVQKSFYKTFEGRVGQFVMKLSKFMLMFSVKKATLQSPMSVS